MKWWSTMPRSCSTNREPFHFFKFCKPLEKKSTTQCSQPVNLNSSPSWHSRLVCGCAGAAPRVASCGYNVSSTTVTDNCLIHVAVSKAKKLPNNRHSFRHKFNSFWIFCFETFTGLIFTAQHAVVPSVVHPAFKCPRNSTPPEFTLFAFSRVPRTFEGSTAEESAVKCCPAALRYIPPCANPNVVDAVSTPVLWYWKIHVIRKIDPGIQYEPVYRPANSLLPCIQHSNNLWATVTMLGHRRGRVHTAEDTHITPLWQNVTFVNSKGHCVSKQPKKTINTTFKLILWLI